MDMNYDLIGMRIKYYRMKRGLSQEKLGELVNISNRHLSKVETGSKNPSLGLIIDIANALNITADDLLADYLTGISSEHSELTDILDNCSDRKKAILLDMLKHMNTLLSEYGI